MSRTSILTRFRQGWSYSEYVNNPSITPSDTQFYELLDRVLSTISAERPHEGEQTTIEFESGETEVILPDNFLANWKNKQILSKVLQGIDPNVPELQPSPFNYRQSAFSSNRYSEFAHNISKPLKAPAYKMLPILIQKKKVEGIYKNVWKLQSAFTSAKSCSISYDAKHSIENAKSILNVVTQPSAGETILVEHSELEEAALTFVGSGASGNQINIGASKAETATNIKNKLISSGFGFILNSQLGATINLSSPDGEEFTITPDGTKITNTYTEAKNTILFNQEDSLMKLLNAYALRGLTPQQLAKEKSISEINTIADKLEQDALNKLRKRSTYD